MSEFKYEVVKTFRGIKEGKVFSKGSIQEFEIERADAINKAIPGALKPLFSAAEKAEAEKAAAEKAAAEKAEADKAAAEKAEADKAAAEKAEADKAAAEKAEADKAKK